jgi:hypothetical protein
MAKETISRRGFLEITALFFAGEALSPLVKLFPDTKPSQFLEPTVLTWEHDKDRVSPMTRKALFVTALLEEYQNNNPQKSEEHERNPLPIFFLEKLSQSKEYSELKYNTKFFNALKYVNDSHNTVPDEAIQCYGLAHIMSTLFSTKVLGGNTVEKAVKDIVLPLGFNRKEAGKYPTPTGFIAIKLGTNTFATYTLADMKVGDFFVEYKQDSIGHIGFVADICVRNGKKIFSIVDANYQKQLTKEGDIVTVRDGHTNVREFTQEQFVKEYTDGTGVSGSITLLTLDDSNVIASPTPRIDMP